jgi:hypothetical protein
MTLNETLTVALLSSVTGGMISLFGHILIAKLQKGNEQSKFFREKLLDRYAEFVAVASADLERAKTQQACMAIHNDGHDLTELDKLGVERHSLHRDLVRLSMQIRLMEEDSPLFEKVQGVTKLQPFMAYPFPPRWGQGSYTERAEKFDSDIASLEKLLSEFVEEVQNKHSRRGFRFKA